MVDRALRLAGLCQEEGKLAARGLEAGFVGQDGAIGGDGTRDIAVTLQDQGFEEAKCRRASGPVPTRRASAARAPG